MVDAPVEAPLAIRPGGVRESAHLLSALRVVHARENQLAAMRDDDVPRIGHSTFVWTEGRRAVRHVGPRRFLSCFFDESCDSDEAALGRRRREGQGRDRPRRARAGVRQVRGDPARRFRHDARGGRVMLNENQGGHPRALSGGSG